MLGRLSGKTHSVLTGIAVIRLPDGAIRSKVESTSVRLAPLSNREIDQYVATGDPLDKAGGYAIQGYGAALVNSREFQFTRTIDRSIASSTLAGSLMI